MYQHFDSLDEVIVLAFCATVQRQAEAKRGHALAQADPSIVGQVAHSVLPGANVYLIKTAERGSDLRYTKIGVSRDVSKRISGINTDSPLIVHSVDYLIAGSEELAYRLEAHLHEQFASCRISGEWFMHRSANAQAEFYLDAKDIASEFLRIDCNNRWFSYDPACKLTRDEVADLRVYYRKAVEMITDKFAVFP